MGGDTLGGKYACVKCSATVNASLDAILKLFEDNTRCGNPTLSLSLFLSRSSSRFVGVVSLLVPWLNNNLMWLKHRVREYNSFFDSGRYCLL